MVVFRFQGCYHGEVWRLLAETQTCCRTKRLVWQRTENNTHVSGIVLPYKDKMWRHYDQIMTSDDFTITWLTRPLSQPTWRYVSWWPDWDSGRDTPAACWDDASRQGGIVTAGNRGRCCTCYYWLRFGLSATVRDRYLRGRESWSLHN